MQLKLTSERGVCEAVFSQQARERGALKMKSTIIAIAVMVLFLASPAWSYVIGDSNLPFTGYPDPTCIEPSVPYSFSNQYEVDSFNNEVDEYRECIKRYVEAAELDQKRISEKIDETVTNFNLFIQTIRNR